jgi:tetratricopeptide (TPR) repeat protein
MFAMMHTNNAAALYGLRRTDDALRELDVALRLDPTNVGALYTKGAILFNLGRVQEAIPWLERAVRGAPFNALFRENLDTARAATGNR